MEELLRVNEDKTLILRDDRFRVYLDRETIQARVAAMGKQITDDFRGKKPILIGVLNGAFMFLADLMRHVEIECEVDFMKLSSYGAAKISSGVVQELKKIDAEIEGRHVIIVEDIVDTGLSMQFILEMMSSYNPASLRVATLLHKTEATKVEVPLDYVGFHIKNLFVIGYGLDYGQLGRNLPEIYVIEEDA